MCSRTVWPSSFHAAILFFWGLFVLMRRAVYSVSGQTFSAPLTSIYCFSHSPLSVPVSLSFFVWGGSQSVSRWAVGSLWFRVTADTFSEDWEALQDCERSTPVFRCWSWQRARSIMSRGVYTLRPESQTAKSNKSQPNGYWEWLTLLPA